MSNMFGVAGQPLRTRFDPSILRCEWRKFGNRDGYHHLVGMDVYEI